MKLINAFSIGMLGPVPEHHAASVAFRRITSEQARHILDHGIESAVGHPSTAVLLSDLLGLEVPANRMSVALMSGERAIVAQYVGPHLPDGAIKLPSGAEIQWFEIEILERSF